MMNNDLKDAQIASAIWRPFTQEKTASKPIKILRGEGLYLYAEDGRRYADMISSWWVNIHGHSNPEIAEVIFDQAKVLEQVIFTAFYHDPAEELVKKLRTVLPAKLNHFFFSDDGSTAVEVALKIAYQSFKNSGNPKRKIFLHLEDAYHGDTLGAMSVSGRNSQYHFNFSDFFFDTIAVKVPEYYEGVTDIEQREDEIIENLEKQLDEVGEQVCALIVEPLLQGARGMVVYRPEFLRKLIQLVKKYGILVIFDEIMTGFYRTGRFWAMDHLLHKNEMLPEFSSRTDFLPDIICISKALTGGFLPLSITITTDAIYEAFLSDDPGKTFIHGHSYTGNPIACAAACKSFDILMRKENLDRIQNIEDFFRSAQMEQVSKKRNLGTMVAFEMSSAESAKNLCEKLFLQGIFIRPLDKTVYLLPPYCVNQSELEWVWKTMQKIIRSS